MTALIVIVWSVIGLIAGGVGEGMEAHCLM